MHALMFIGCMAAFSALALATERQQQALCGRLLASAASRALQWAGWALLLLCLWLAAWTWGWGFGLVAYSGHTSLAAGCVYLLLVIAGRRSHPPQQR